MKLIKILKEQKVTKESLETFMENAFRATEKEISRARSSGFANFEGALQEELNRAREAMTAKRYQIALMQLFFIFRDLGRLDQYKQTQLDLSK